jgi:hypothetical protein
MSGCGVGHEKPLPAVLSGPGGYKMFAFNPVDSGNGIHIGTNHSNIKPRSHFFSQSVPL